jgi:hypothetical protein
MVNTLTTWNRDQLALEIQISRKGRDFENTIYDCPAQCAWIDKERIRKQARAARPVKIINK